LFPGTTWALAERNRRAARALLRSARHPLQHLSPGQAAGSVRAAQLHPDRRGAGDTQMRREQEEWLAHFCHFQAALVD
jgi:hypothetical protein